MDLLQELNLVIIDMEGDGNCLFRSISHQAYGTCDFHLEIRQKCMNYILAGKEFFKVFIADEDIDVYC